MYLWKGLLPDPFTREGFLSPFYLWSWDTKSQVQSLRKASSPTEINQNISSEVPRQAHGTAGSRARGLQCNLTDPSINPSILWEVKPPSSAATFLLAVSYFSPVSRASGRLHPFPLLSLFSSLYRFTLVWGKRKPIPVQLPLPFPCWWKAGLGSCADLYSKRLFPYPVLKSVQKEAIFFFKNVFGEGAQ